MIQWNGEQTIDDEESEKKKLKFEFYAKMGNIVLKFNCRKCVIWLEFRALDWYTVEASIEWL